MRPDLIDKRIRHQTVGRFIRKMRLRAGLTQWDVARELGYTSAQFISNWERGISLPPTPILSALGRILQAEPHEVFDVMVEYQSRVMAAYRKKLASTLRVSS